MLSRRASPTAPMGAPWGSMGAPWGWGPPWGPHAVFVACCAVNIPIYWQYLEGFEPTTQCQFLESFKTILWEVLNTYAVSVTRPALFCGVGPLALSFAERLLFYRVP